MLPPELALRPATEQDREFLLQVYGSTREEELRPTGWPAEQCERFVRMQFQAQTQHYWQHYPDSVCQLITQDRGEGPRALGRLWLDSRPGSLHVLDISLIPAARGQGIGTALLRSLMAACREDRKDLSIFVELHNPARRLYERLGFEAEGEEQGLYQFMRWRRDTVSQTATGAIAPSLAS